MNLKGFSPIVLYFYVKELNDRLTRIFGKCQNMTTVQNKFSLIYVLNVENLMDDY